MISAGTELAQPQNAITGETALAARRLLCFEVQSNTAALDFKVDFTIALRLSTLITTCSLFLQMSTAATISRRRREEGKELMEVNSNLNSGERRCMVSTEINTCIPVKKYKPPQH